MKGIHHIHSLIEGVGGSFRRSRDGFTSEFSRTKTDEEIFRLTLSELFENGVMHGDLVPFSYEELESGLVCGVAENAYIRRGRNRDTVILNVRLVANLVADG